MCDRLDYSQGINRTGYDLYGVSSNLLRSVTFEGNGYLSRPSLTVSSYLTDHWQVRPNLFFELGVREDWDEILRRWLWSPRASFSYAPFGSATTRAYRAALRCCTIPPSSSLFTRPFDQYTLTDITHAATERCCCPMRLSYYTLPNEHLKAPLYQNWSLGVDHQFPWRIRAGLSLHRKRGGDGFAYVNTLPAPIPASPEIAARLPCLVCGAAIHPHQFAARSVRRRAGDRASGHRRTL